jgi:hypothetical protein
VSEKTIINWTGGGTLQTWTNGEWQILYAKDSAGNCVTLSLTSHDAVRLAYAVSPVPNEQFERLREANSAVQELSYPEARSDELRQVADVIDCGGGCGRCGSQSLDRGEFCDFVAAENLRKLAAALDLKAKIDAAAPSRPDAGGGVREAQHIIEGILLSRIYQKRIEGYTIETAKEIATALSTPPAAVESNASVEARLREALLEIANRAANMGDPDATDWLPSIYLIACESAGEDPWPLLRRMGYSQDGLTITLSTAVGDEAKKSEGGPLNWQLSDDAKARLAEIDANLRNAAINASNIVAGNPSSPTAERREIVARIRDDVIEECAKLAETHKGYPTPVSEKIRSLKTGGER